jgi:hypothetical protein
MSSYRRSEIGLDPDVQKRDLLALREALYTYEGSRGYQPMLAVWAEMDGVLADEFRDGNVPA